MGSKKYKYPFWYMSLSNINFTNIPQIAIGRMVDDHGARFICDFYIEGSLEYLKIFSQLEVEKYMHSYGEGSHIGYNSEIVKKAISFIFTAKKLIVNN